MLRWRDWGVGQYDLQRRMKHGRGRPCRHRRNAVAAPVVAAVVEGLELAVSGGGRGTMARKRTQNLDTVVNLYVF